MNLARLMRIAIEGPQLSTTDFSEILEIFKETNLGRIELGQNSLERLRADKWSVYTSPTTLPL